MLNKLILIEQTGHMGEYYIGENIKLIYDILHINDKLDIPGLLLIIDLKKKSI